MAIIVILFLLPVLAVGGYRLAINLRGINFTTVPGALLGMVIVMRFLAYTALAAPLAAISVLIHGDNPDSQIISVPFRVQFEEVAFSITGMGVSDIEQLAGDLSLGSPDGVTVAIFCAYVLAVVVLIHFIGLNGQKVLRTVYERNPFVGENSRLLHRAALLSFAIWAITVAYHLLMTAYLQSQLTSEGIQLSFRSFNIIGPLFIVGLIFVLAEVFRVGYELKQENELTV